MAQCRLATCINIRVYMYKYIVLGANPHLAVLLGC